MLVLCWCLLWLSLEGAQSHAVSSFCLQSSCLPAGRQNRTRRYDCICVYCLRRAKGFQHQRMTNGAMNVEIGNPAYKIYEGEPDDDAGELLDADFTLDPEKVRQPRRAQTPNKDSHVSWWDYPECFSAHQLHKPRIRHSVHGSPQQPQLFGEHGREEGVAITWRRRAPRRPSGIDSPSGGS